MGDSGGGGTGIVVKCRVHPLALLLLPCRTTIAVDDASAEGRWGTHFFPCGPGSHRVHVTFTYLGERLGDAIIDVEVRPGQTIRVNYQSPPMFFLFLTSRTGSIQIASEPIGRAPYRCRVGTGRDRSG